MRLNTSASKEDPARSIVSVDPSRCRVWSLHDRFASEITTDSCKDEITSIAAHGQRIPVLGRPLTGDPECEVELAYGARRLFVARHLNVPLLVELREFTDREGLIALDIENRQRRDISPYERGLAYKRWLSAGHFKSQEEIAAALDISPAQISRLLQLTRLPAVVVDAFRTPTEIREGWGLKLIEALDDPQRRTATIRAARALSNCSPRPQARDVMPRLLPVSELGRKPKKELHDRVVQGRNGSPLFRIRYLSDAIAFVLAADMVSEKSLSRIENTLSTVLQEARARKAKTRVRPEPIAVRSRRPGQALDPARGLTI